jgi:hypothetical protein
VVVQLACVEEEGSAMPPVQMGRTGELAHWRNSISAHAIGPAIKIAFLNHKNIYFGT